MNGSIFETVKFNRHIRRLKMLGNHSYVDPSTYLGMPQNIEISEYVHINKNCKLFAEGGLIHIGKGSIFAHEIQIFTRNHNYNSEDLMYLPYDERFISKPVSIGEYVWIGAGVIILPGVTVGDGAVIGAGSVITHSIPKGAVVCGNPGVIVKYRDLDKFEELRSKEASYIKNTKTY